jgi:F-box-like
MTNLDPPQGENLTSKIPPEILIVIFSLMDRNSRDIKQITAVCGRWREIALHIPYLWTKIVIDLRGRNQEQVHRLLCTVELFLDRAGSLPLDVAWAASRESDLDSLFYTLFRQKGTFNRWKTLILEIDQGTVLPVCEIREVDRFSSLENLKFLSNPPLALLDIVNRTSGAKLRTLELGSTFRCSPTFIAEYGGLLEHIDRLHVRSGVILPLITTASNITILDAHRTPGIPMPSVRHLRLTKLHLSSFHIFHPENLVTLLISGSISHAPAGLTIILPRLLWLGFGGTSCSNIAAFKVASLHTLSIRWEGQEPQSYDGPFVTGLRSGFEAPKLLILDLNVLLNGHSTLEILRLFPNLSRVNLYFPDSNHGKETLSYAFPDRRDVTVCPSLDILRVILKAPPTSVSTWKGLVGEIACNIRESFWKLESKWPGGGYSKCIGIGDRPKAASIHPWREQYQRFS